MVKSVIPEVLEAIHAIACNPSDGWMVQEASRTPYYEAGDYEYLELIYEHEYYGVKMILALLILAAEEGLEGYPMEAVE